MAVLCGLYRNMFDLVSAKHHLEYLLQEIVSRFIILMLLCRRPVGLFSTFLNCRLSQCDCFLWSWCSGLSGAIRAKAFPYGRLCGKFSLQQQRKNVIWVPALPTAGMFVRGEWITYSWQPHILSHPKIFYSLFRLSSSVTSDTKCFWKKKLQNLWGPVCKI